MTIKSTNHLTHITTLCALLYSNSALCAELVEYDHTFLMGKGTSSTDLSRYTKGDPTLPGTYDVSMYVSDQPITSQSIVSTVIEGKKNVQVCITQKNLLQFHISSPDENSEKVILFK